MSVSTPGYFDRKPPSAQVRPGLAHLQADPSSPLTPQRAISSAVSSPSVSFRAEEEPLIFEFGSRHLSAGFAGESYPRCTIDYGQERSRRVGDYRRWLPGWDTRPRKSRRIASWGDDHELWRMDLRVLDMGLVQDKIERSVREAYTKHLLLDYKSSKKLILMLPSIMPHQLLSLVLTTLFKGSPAPQAITLLPPPALITAAAGCRSSLVVDIGWRETLITAVYEFREVQQRRTMRAMRWVALEFAKLLEERDPVVETDVRSIGGSTSKSLKIELDQVEEILTRLAWCRSRQDVGSKDSADDNMPVSIPSPFSGGQSLELPFTTFAKPVEESLLANNNATVFDDQEQPLDLIIYKSLLALPTDVRSLCMSRIIITGGGSNIPGLKSRLLEEVATLVEERGWDPVFGKVTDGRRARRKEVTSPVGDGLPTLTTKMHAFGVRDPSSVEVETAKTPPHLDPRIPDFIDEKLLGRQGRNLNSMLPKAGQVQGVESLGAWAGASMLATLRIKGIVEVDKDMFLQHGLDGARRDAEISAAPQKSLGSAVPKAGERPNWTLGAWA